MADTPQADVPARRSQYYYRRELSARELLPALGVAVGAGLAAFYIARVLIQRTALEVIPRGFAGTQSSESES